MNAEAFWKAAAQRLDAGMPVFIVLVVANTRGSPGTRGARLLLDSNGVVGGTVGGGIMEAELIEQARHRLATGHATPPVLRRLVHRKKGTDHPSGLICAGEQTNLSLILQPDRDAAAIRRFSDAVENQAHRSARLVIDDRGVHVIEDAISGATPDMQLIEDGDGWRYEETSLNQQRLAIVGGGHCGKALARLAVEIGYWVDVFDTRVAVLQADDWPEAVRRHALNDYAELRARLAHTSLATVVVMTAAVYHDITALASIALADPRWLGVMGSAAKIRKIRKELRDRGIAAARVNAIHGPIGLCMKSDTPAEIAVSIMSQLLTERPECSGPGGLFDYKTVS
ncbi:MAG TPA: XdhC family protein [Salinisphaera sp.]|nr:XdhC family protein [Salinisphaera sp.]